MFKGNDIVFASIKDVEYIDIKNLSISDIEKEKQNLIKLHTKKIIENSGYSEEKVKDLCGARIFFVIYNHFLVLCGLYNIIEKRDKVGEYISKTHFCGDYLLYNTENGFYFVKSCSAPLRDADISKCVSPMIFWTLNNGNITFLKYGKTYDSYSLNKVNIVSNLRTYLPNEKRNYCIKAWCNTTKLYEIDNASLFCELPSANGTFLYSVEEDNMKYFVQSILVDVILQKEEKLLCNGGYYFPYNDKTPYPQIMSKVDNINMRTSDKDNYYFYISKNETVAFYDLMSCIEQNGSYSIIKNLFDEDATLNYKISVPKENKINEFIMTLIFSSSAFYPRIFGVPIHEVMEVICRDYPYNPYALPEHRIDENSSSAIIKYIKDRYPDITNEEIAKRLALTYGQYATAEKHDKYWMYFHGESLREERLPGDYYKSLGKSTLNVKWKSEWNLYCIAIAYYSDAVIHYSPDWLKGQHLDVFIPSLSLGIEYQGEQHYHESTFFGGKNGFEKRKHLDDLKRDKCDEKSILLLEWPYSLEINIINFINLIMKHGVINIPNPDPMRIPKSYDDREKIFRQEINVCQYSTTGVLINVFKSYLDAEKETGINKKTIYKAVGGYNKSAGGYQWRCSHGDVLEHQIEPLTKSNSISNICPVYQISGDGEILAEFKSISQASRITGINAKSIRCVLQGAQSRAGGFIWKAKN